MTSLALNDVYDRGLRDFGSLTKEERCLFVIHDLDVYFEMEGGFDDYFLSGGHEAEIKTLVATLRAIEDEKSLSAILRIAAMKDEDRAGMNEWCRTYYERRNERWSRMEAFFAVQGIVVKETE